MVHKTDQLVSAYDEPCPTRKEFSGPSSWGTAKVGLISLSRSTGSGLQQRELGHCEECISSAPELDDWLENL